MTKQRIIFHIDVNNAFLSWTAVELLRQGYPTDIRTIPSIIGGDESKRRGVVLAKSPVAKKFGVQTAETLYVARKKCPNLQVFPPNHKLYQEQSDLLFRYLSTFTPVVERFSIDECFLDMTGTSYLYDDYLALAFRIKEEIKKKFGFTVNIGIAENKLCAKMASDFQKPDKVHTLYQSEIQEKLWPLPVGDLFMIGRKTVPLLEVMNIKTIGDLALKDPLFLKKKFKSMGEYMISAANGIDDTPVEAMSGPNKCISTTETFSYDIDDPSILKKFLLRQSERVGYDLRHQEQYAYTVAVLYKTETFQSYSHQEKLKNPVHTTEDIYQVACRLFDRSFRGEPLRLMGIRLSDFTKERSLQVSFFEEDKKKDNDKMQKTIDTLNDKFGGVQIMPASLLEGKRKPKETGQNSLKP